jgi:hypothetical protein
MRLVAEVHASFQKLTHIERRKRHGSSFFRLVHRGPREDLSLRREVHRSAKSGAFNPPKREVRVRDEGTYRVYTLK